MNYIQDTSRKDDVEIKLESPKKLYRYISDRCLCHCQLAHVMENRAVLSHRFIAQVLGE